VVMGSPRNIKITTPADMELAEFLLKSHTDLARKRTFTADCAEERGLMQEQETEAGYPRVLECHRVYSDVDMTLDACKT